MSRQKPPFNALNFTFEEVRDLSVRQINAAFRDADESDKWPVCGKFNATERAIRKTRKFRQATGTCGEGAEYALELARAISEIVNNET